MLCLLDPCNHKLKKLLNIQSVCPPLGVVHIGNTRLISEFLSHVKAFYGPVCRNILRHAFGRKRKALNSRTAQRISPPISSQIALPPKDVHCRRNRAYCIRSRIAPYIDSFSSGIVDRGAYLRLDIVIMSGRNPCKSHFPGLCSS